MGCGESFPIENKEKNNYRSQENRRVELLFFDKDEAPETASVVPLAFPLIAGAGTMTTILSLKAEFQTVNIIVAIIINMIFVYIVLKSSSKIEKFIGKGGINVVRKIFGVILLAIAVKLFASNIQGLLN